MTTAASLDDSDHVGRRIPEWTLGDRLRRARRDIGLSQSDFAKRLGENPKSYASWESDHSSPRNLVALAKRIEAMSGIPAAWILDVPFLSAAPQTHEAVAQIGTNGSYFPTERHLVVVEPLVTGTDRSVVPNRVVPDSAMGPRKAGVTQKVNTERTSHVRSVA